MVTEQLQHKQALDEQNDRYALENYIDSLIPREEISCLKESVAVMNQKLNNLQSRNIKISISSYKIWVKRLIETDNFLDIVDYKTYFEKFYKDDVPF